nr:MAG TPA: hypothetical protein [Caudoviricetes sp.]
MGGSLFLYLHPLRRISYIKKGSPIYRRERKLCRKSA